MARHGHADVDQPQVSKEKYMNSRKSCTSTHRSKSKFALIATLAICIATPNASYAGVVADSASASAGNASRWAELEMLLTQELQRAVDRQPRISGQSKLVNVRAKIDPATKMVTLHMSRGYVPSVNGSEFEDLQSQLNNIGLEIVRPELDSAGVDYRFEGRTIFDYLPSNVPNIGQGLPLLARLSMTPS
jgi:hypothetical protein